MTTPSVPVLVERWKRYGHDRAYVKFNGDQIGYRDLKTGEVSCTDPDQVELIEAATKHLVAARTDDATETAQIYTPRDAVSADQPLSQSEVTKPLAGVPAPVVQGPVLAPDQDLAVNAAGSAARAQAVAMRQAAPVRTFIARVAGVKTDERAWRIGADAEEEVARRLGKLGQDWRVLHAIPIGDRGSDIDHLVIGPAGVFTLNTKHHPDANVWIRGDTVKVNGQNHPYVRNSRFEARRAATLLSARAGFDVGLTGLVVIMGASGGYTVKEQPADGSVFVVQRRQLVPYLRGLPVILGAPSVERIYDVARHLSTWRPNKVGWSDL